MYICIHIYVQFAYIYTYIYIYETRVRTCAWICMYVCIFVYNSHINTCIYIYETRVCTCAWICMYVCTFIYNSHIYTYIHFMYMKHVSALVRMYIHVPAHVGIRTCVCLHRSCYNRLLHLYLNMCIYICLHLCLYMYIYIYTYIYDSQYTCIYVYAPRGETSPSHSAFSDRWESENHRSLLQKRPIKETVFCKRDSPHGTTCLDLCEYMYT